MSNRFLVLVYHLKGHHIHLPLSERHLLTHLPRIGKRTKESMRHKISQAGRGVTNKERFPTKGVRGRWHYGH